MDPSTRLTPFHRTVSQPKTGAANGHGAHFGAGRGHDDGREQEDRLEQHVGGRARLLHHRHDALQLQVRKSTQAIMLCMYVCITLPDQPTD